MIVMLSAIILASVLVLFVLTPLLPSQRRRYRWQALGEQEETLQEQRAALADSLRTLESDYRIGDLMEADYHALRDRYRRQAAALFQGSNGYEAIVDEEIELAVRELRESRTSPHPGASTETCPACGAAYGVEGRFCPRCGARRDGDGQ